MTLLDTQVAVLGGGPAGYVAAMRAAQLGADVTLIEKETLGGVCLNVGCIPTKALLKTARLATDIRKSKEFGIEAQLSRVDWEVAVERKNRVVRSLNLGLDQLMKTHNIKLLKGRGTIISPYDILVSTEDGEIRLQCRKMVLATGSSPLLPAIPGIDLPGVMTSTEALALTELPESIAIIGAGVIGLEFASIYAGAGVKVTVLEQAERPLPQEDEEIALELLKLLKRQGIAIKTSARVIEIRPSDSLLEVEFDQDTQPERKQSIKAQRVLIGAGRKLNTEMLAALPLEIQNGAIVVDQHMQTSIEGIYAAGDVIGGKLLAHLAYAEGRIAAENALGIASSINYRAVPSCIYTHPEYATVGFTETEAQKLGLSPKVGSFALRQNGRALTLGEREGMVKIIADQENTIIGAQILGPEASELISELTLAITLKAKVDVLAEMIHPHPTLGEAIWEACNALLGRPVHSV